MYNGFANRDSFMFDITWSNDGEVYKAILAEGRRLHEWMPTMSEQTFGLNILNAVKAAVNGGGWGYDGVPLPFQSVPGSNLRNLGESCNLNNVNETEFGAQVMRAIDREDLPAFEDIELPEIVDTDPALHLLKADRVNEDEIEALESLISRLNGSALADFLRCITDGLRSGHDLTLIVGLKNNSD